MTKDNVRQLGVVSVTQSIRADVVAGLEKALEEAKRGEIDEIFVIAKTADGFRELASPTQHFAEWIGRLEITKASWLHEYIKNRDAD
jgi:hypothetical protein